jgi:hypothetical protein
MGPDFPFEVTANEEGSKTNGHVQKESIHSSSGILQVYVAYETGLSKGTRVRLHVTEKTTAREVVTLVLLLSNTFSSPIFEENASFGELSSTLHGNPPRTDLSRANVMRNLIHRVPFHERSKVCFMTKLFLCIIYLNMKNMSV